MASSLVLNNQMRFQGNAVYAMIGIITGAVLNIGLAPLFIFVFDMGIAGACMVVVALLICALRVLAGAHYVRDVAAGALLGFALGAAGMYLL